MVVIVTIYDAKETNFTHHGIGGLSPISCKIGEEINGQYSLTMEHPKDPEGRWERIQKERIIKAPGPEGDQLFRVQSIQKSLDGGLSVTALHIFYDLLDNFIEDIYPTQKTGDEAIKAILAGCQYASGFSASSNITTRNNARLVRMNPVAALIGDEDQAFINRWGGEIKRDNFNIAINSRVGEDRGVCIRYRKNLTGLNLTEDYSEVKTRIMATGLNEDDTVFEIPEVYGGPYIDSSDHLNDYAHPKIGYVHYSDIKIGAEAEDGSIPYPTQYDAYVELHNRVIQMYSSGADVPKITLDVQFADLSHTAEYAGYAALETVRIGDTVRVVHEGLGVDYSLRMTTYTWDCLLERYESVTLGVRPENLGDAINSTDIDLSILSEQVSDAVKVGEKYNKVFITHEEGFVSETADGNARTHMSGTDGFVAEAYVGGKWSKVVITGGEPFSVYYNGQRIGGLQLIGDQLVMIANRTTNQSDASIYLDVGRDVDGFAGMRFYDTTKNQEPVIAIYESANNRAAIDSQKDIIIGTKTGEDGSKQPRFAVNKDDSILLNGETKLFGTVNMESLTEIQTAGGQSGYTGTVIIGEQQLTFRLGILVDTN